VYVAHVAPVRVRPTDVRRAHMTRSWNVVIAEAGARDFGKPGFALAPNESGIDREPVRFGRLRVKHGPINVSLSDGRS